MSRSSKARCPLILPAVALAVAALGCQLLVDLDGLEDRHCSEGYKACPNGGCVPFDDPATGCNDPGCSPCAPMNAIGICSQTRHCSFDRNTCIGDWDDCDGIPSNGCETDLAHNPLNCGGCGIVCAKPMDGTAGCSKGVCGIGSCNPGHEDCDHDPSDGCETTIWTDQQCLTCDLPCPDGQHCNQGMCL